MLQQTVKHAIPMPNGIAPFRVQIVAKRPDRSRINAMRHVHKIKPDSGVNNPGVYPLMYELLPHSMPLLDGSPIGIGTAGGANNDVAWRKIGAYASVPSLNCS
jgi:hypothetical protein